MQRVGTMPGAQAHTDYCSLFLDVHQSDFHTGSRRGFRREGAQYRSLGACEMGKRPRNEGGAWALAQDPVPQLRPCRDPASNRPTLLPAEAAAGGHFLTHADIENSSRASHWQDAICIQKSGSGKVWERSLDFPAPVVSGHPWRGRLSASQWPLSPAAQQPEPLPSQWTLIQSF